MLEHPEGRAHGIGGWLATVAITVAMASVAMAEDEPPPDVAPPAPLETGQTPFTARETWPDGQEAGEVVRGERVVLVIRSELSGLSPFERAMIAAKRLNDFVEDYGPNGPLVITVSGGEYVIRGGARPIVTIDAVAARAEGRSAGEVADRWLEAIRRALSPASGDPGSDTSPPTSGSEPANGAPPKVVAPPMLLGAVSSPEGGAAPAPGLRAPVFGAAEEPTGLTHLPTPTLSLDTPAPATAGEAARPVPLVDATTGAPAGTAAVGGPQASTARVAAVALAARAAGDVAVLRCLLPVATVPPGGRDGRVAGAYVCTILPGAAVIPPSASTPETTALARELQTGEPGQAVVMLAADIDAALLALAKEMGCPMGEPTRVVPLFLSEDACLIGAAQLCGSSDELMGVTYVVDSPDPGGRRFVPMRLAADGTPVPVARVGVAGLLRLVSRPAAR